jgi:hypothetical protein
MFWSEQNPPLELERPRVIDAAVSRWFPLYGEHKSLRRLLASAWEGRPPKFTMDATGFMSVVQANPARVRSDFDHHLRLLAATAPGPILSADNVRALVRLRELTERYQLDVTIAPAPIFDELWQIPRLRAYMNQLHVELRDAVGSHVRVVTEPPPTFEAKDMENVDHVVGDAAINYTQWLVSVLTSTHAQRD